MTRIIGLAAPYNKRNAYEETFLPGIFKDFLARKEPIPMLYKHYGLPVGHWTGMWEGSDGLWVDGLVDKQRLEARIRAGKLDGLSVSFKAPSFELTRFGRAEKEWGALAFLIDPDTLPLPPQDFDRADLTEISLTPNPAFKESRFHWEDVK